MRTFLLGGVLGAVAAAGLAGVLSMGDLPQSTQIAAAVITLVLVAGLVWGLGLLWSALRWVREAWRRRSVRSRRRKNLGSERTGRAGLAGRSAFEGEETETVLMTGARQRGKMTRAEMAARLHEAQAAALQGDFRAAADLYSDVIDASPDHLDAHLARGRVYLDLGDYNRAMSDFVMAEEIDPDSPEPPVAMGELYFVRKDYARAIGAFDIALDLEPRHAMAWCRRGLSHFYRKNYPLAMEDLLHAQALDPDIPNLQSHIAAARQKVKESARPRRR